MPFRPIPAAKFHFGDHHGEQQELPTSPHFESKNEKGHALAWPFNVRKEPFTPP